MQVDELYTPLFKALNELERRRADASLTQKVEDYFRASPPPKEFLQEAYAVVAPSLITPNLEMEYLMDIWQHLNIKGLILEFAKDKFVHLNAVKHALGEMTFFKQMPSGHKNVLDSVRIVNFQEAQGKSMDKIQTLGGENFKEFHHRIFSAHFQKADFKIVDFSDWFLAGKSFNPEFPYMRYLGLFITHGVLFANFTLEKREKAFTETVVIPAFLKLKEALGVEPLIVPIEPISTDDQKLWCYYPESVRSLL